MEMQYKSTVAAKQKNKMAAQKDPWDIYVLYINFKFSIMALGPELD